MIRSLRLVNFKAFEEVRVDFAPLTVLLGANSTGKSSILHALVLLKQSLRGGDYRVPLTFGGPLINLGRLKDIGWQGKTSLLFELEWDNGHGITFEVKPYRRAGLLVTRENFSVRIGGKKYFLQNSENVEPWYFSFFPREVPFAERESLASALLSVNGTVTDFFARLRYVGPLRESFREVPFSGEEPESVGPDARFLIPFLKFRPDVTRRISQWLRDRGLADGLEVKETAKGSGRWAAYLVEKEGRRVNLADTGFGYSQLIPVLAELYGAPEGSLILIEQPELHLNPRLAVWMGDVLLSAVEDGKAVLAETHSEHILLRLRRRMAEGSLSSNQVAIYFAHRSLHEGKSYLVRIDLDERGQPTRPWPEGFWGEDYEESFHLARALAKWAGEER